MSSAPARPWQGTSHKAAEGEFMSEFVQGLLVGAVAAAGALALGIWLLKQ